MLEQRPDRLPPRTINMINKRNPPVIGFPTEKLRLLFGVFGFGCGWGRGRFAFGRADLVDEVGGMFVETAVFGGEAHARVAEPFVKELPGATGHDVDVGVGEGSEFAEFGSDGLGGGDVAAWGAVGGREGAVVIKKDNLETPRQLIPHIPQKFTKIKPTKYKPSSSEHSQTLP